MFFIEGKVAFALVGKFSDLDAERMDAVFRFG